MKFIFYFFRLIFVTLFSYLLYFFIIKFFTPIFETASLIFPYAIHPFDICEKIPTGWFYIKLIFKLTLFCNLFSIINSIFPLLFPIKVKSKHKKTSLKKRKTKNRWFGYFTSSSSGIMFRRNVMLYDTIRIYLLWRNEASYKNRIYRGDTGKSQKYICRNA